MRFSNIRFGIQRTDRGCVAQCAARRANGWALAGTITGGILGATGSVYGNRWTLGRIAVERTAGGIGSEIQGGSFANGFELTAGFDLLRWGAFEMREAMVEQSCTPLGNLNCTGQSVGANGDGIKLAGGRLPWLAKTWNAVRPSWLGGNQGEAGKIFGVDYAAGGFADKLIESYEGPHDWLSSFRYGIRGELIPYTRFGSALFNVYSGAAVALATPFAIATAYSTAVFIPAIGEGTRI